MYVQSITLQHTDTNIITTNITILIQTLRAVQIIIFRMIFMIITTTKIIILGRWKRWIRRKVLILTVGGRGAAVRLWRTLQVSPRTLQVSWKVLGWDPGRSFWIQSLEEETGWTRADLPTRLSGWSRTCWEKVPFESKPGGAFRVPSSGLEKTAKENGGLFSPILSRKRKRVFFGFRRFVNQAWNRETCFYSLTNENQVDQRWAIN